MWSIGCIFAELLLRRPFLPGDDTENQLELIVNCLGQPEHSFLRSFNEGRMVEIFQEMDNQNENGYFDEIFDNCDPTAVNLLKQMLKYNPEERITIEDALKHDFIGDWHCEKDEPTTVPVSAFDFDFEMYDLTIENSKQLILEEISLYHSKKAQKKYVKNKKAYPQGMLHLYFESENTSSANPEELSKSNHDNPAQTAPNPDPEKPPISKSQSTPSQDPENPKDTTPDTSVPKPTEATTPPRDPPATKASP